MENLENYYAENVEVKVRNLMNMAKSQIEFKLVHNDYVAIRNNTLLNVNLYFNHSSSSMNKCLSKIISTKELSTFFNKLKPSKK